MNLQIVDTNVLILFAQNDRRLPKRAAARIEDPSRRTLVSMASLWEISIKVGIGKLKFNAAKDPAFPDRLERNGFQLLSIGWDAICRAAELPWIHRDPFDRLILAEAFLHNAPILSTDSKLDAYGIERIAD